MKKEKNQVENEEKNPSFLEKARIRRERFSLIVSFIGALFFIVSIITKAKDSSESQLFPLIVAFSAIYIVVFVIFLIIHRKNSKQISKDTKNFKSTFKIFNLCLNLLFIGSSLLIFIESLQELQGETKFLVVFETIFSGVLLVFKLISTVKKIIKAIKKKVQAKKKEKEKQAKKENKA